MSEIYRIKWQLVPTLPLLMAMVIISLLTACKNYDDHRHPDLTSGVDFFNHHCAVCHGEKGLGKTPDITPDDFVTLKTREEVFTSAEEVPANVATVRDREGIVDYITTNINPQRKMPVFSNMPREEALAIADHLIMLRHDIESMPEINEIQPMLNEP